MKLLSHPIILSVFLLCFCAGAFFIGHAALSYATFQSAENFCVLLDAGHGGNDPGKVSSSGVKEKDINLAITLKCQSVLEQNGVKVILTRNSDCSLADSNASNKKASDLKKRKALIKESQINCAVSIHQNSFPDTSSHGAQVFYHPQKPDSKRLASLIQAQMQNLTGIQNHRKIKANTDYYLLRDNNTPTVIAEVCFLSNPSEAAMITEETIQEKAAFQIAMGIMQFLHVHPMNSPSISSETQIFKSGMAICMTMDIRKNTSHSYYKIRSYPETDISLTCYQLTDHPVFICY